MHQEILSWLLSMPAKQRQMVINSVQKMARQTHASTVTILEFYYANRIDLRTTVRRGL